MSYSKTVNVCRYPALLTLTALTSRPWRCFVLQGTGDTWPGLHINRIDVDTELNLEGESIDGLSYTDNQPMHGGFFSKLFR